MRSDHKTVKLFEFIGYLISPNRCAFCDTVIPMDEKICGDCSDGLPLIMGKICEKCGCERKYCKCGNALEFSRAVSPLYYLQPFNKGLMKFKNNREKWRAAVFAAYMAETIKRELADEHFDVAVRVPDHRSRLDDGIRGPRLGLGTSPNRVLCEAVSRACDIPFEEGVLAFVSEIAEKQQLLSYESRQINIFAMIDVARPEIPRGRNILLIDDVMTTGATASECAKMLLLHGAKRVCCATLFTTRQERRRR